jgi:hypothetical protein
MTYSFIKPDAGPSPALDAPTIQTNFAQFAAIFSNATPALKNHTAFNGPNQGDHENVIFNAPISDPGVSEDLNVLYCKNADSQLGMQPQLFLQIPKFLPNQFDFTSNPNSGMQITYNQVNTSGPVYQSFLVGGYLIFFGTVTDIGPDIILSPSPSSLYLAVATPYVTSLPSLAQNPMSTTILTIDSFKINSNIVMPYTVGFVAIGKA